MKMIKKLYCYLVSYAGNQNIIIKIEIYNVDRVFEIRFISEKVWKIITKHPLISAYKLDLMKMVKVS